MVLVRLYDSQCSFFGCGLSGPVEMIESGSSFAVDALFCPSCAGSFEKRTCFLDQWLVHGLKSCLVFAGNCC